MFPIIIIDWDFDWLGQTQACILFFGGGLTEGHETGLVL
jgi:hypothetical protein